VAAEFTRDAAATAAIFGFFAAGWFGWAQDHPPKAWRGILIGGSVLSMLIAAAGALFAWRHWSAGTAFSSETGPVFGIIVGIEFALAGLGAIGLTAWGRRELVPAWVAVVVGVHLFPLAPLLRYPLLVVVAALVTAAAVAAIPLARSRSISVSAVTGLGVGSILLGSALVSLLTVVV